MAPADTGNGGWVDGGKQKFRMDKPSLESNFRSDRLIISRKVRGLIGAFMEVSTQRADGWGLFAFKGGQGQQRGTGKRRIQDTVEPGGQVRRQLQGYVT